MNPAAQEDCFGRLPDELVLLIFNKLGDAKILSLCMSVSKRFASLVPHTNTISLSIPPCKPNSKAKYTLAAKVQSKDADDDIVCHSPAELLRNFEKIKSLQIRLSSSDGEVGLNTVDHPLLLKWKADFGNELKSCVILGARAFENCNFRGISSDSWTDPNLMGTLSMWMIACLIAAFERHHLLKQVLAQHQTLQDVVIGDMNKQGILSVGNDEAVDVRSSINSSMATLESPPPWSEIPDTFVKMKYAPLLELPESGFVMRGATLAVIRPVLGKSKKACAEMEIDDDDDLFAFDGEEYEKKAFKEAAKLMLKMEESYGMEIVFP